VTVASPYLGRRSRRVAWLLAGIVAFARVYTGAHLPLDVAGGAALGWLAGALVHLALGVPVPRPALSTVRRALDRVGLAPAGLQPVGTPGRRSSMYLADTAAGTLLVKVVARERRDGDALSRAWRWLTARHDPHGYASAGFALQECRRDLSNAVKTARAAIHVRPLAAGPRQCPWLSRPFSHRCACRNRK